MNGKSMDGRALTVNIARPREERPPAAAAASVANTAAAAAAAQSLLIPLLEQVRGPVRQAWLLSPMTHEATSQRHSKTGMNNPPSGRPH